jgi:hypothetical protein
MLRQNYVRVPLLFMHSWLKTRYYITVKNSLVYENLNKYNGIIYNCLFPVVVTSLEQAVNNLL